MGIDHNEVLVGSPRKSIGTLMNTESQGDDTTSTASSSTQPRREVRLERRQELEQRLKDSPTDRDGYLELALIYRTEERPIDAKRILQQATKIFPDDEQLLWELEEANLARSVQQYRSVKEVADKVQTKEAYRELERSKSDWAGRRMEVCRARLKRDPKKVQLRLTLGEALMDAGMYEGAVEELEQAVQYDELAAHSNLLLGKCYLAMKKDLQAMKSLRACALRRAVVAPLGTRIAALRLLCDTANRLGLDLTLNQYRQQLHAAEQEAKPQST